MTASSKTARSPQPTSNLKVAVCHLESLCGLPALNHLFDVLGQQIGIVLCSRRFGPQHGGVISQFWARARRSGVRFTLWLGFDIVCAQIVDRLARLRAVVCGEPPRLLTLAALARRHDARFIEVDDVHSQQCMDELRSYGPDVVVVMNFDQIFHRQFIAIPNAGVVNIHPSLLPSLRGPCPAFWALAESIDRTGFSIHRIEDEQIDAGRILLQKEVKLDQSSSVAELTSKLFLAGAQALPDALGILQSGCSAAGCQDLNANDYRGFPRRAEVTEAVQKGVRLLRLRYIFHLICSSLRSERGRIDE